MDEYGYNPLFVKGKYEELLEDFGGSRNAKAVLTRLVTSNPNDTNGMQLASNQPASTDGLFVFKVLKNSAAHKAGVCVGDQLLEMNKKSLFGRSNSHAAQVYLEESKRVRVSLVLMRCKDWKTRMNCTPLRFEAHDNIMSDEPVSLVFVALVTFFRSWSKNGEKFFFS